MKKILFGILICITQAQVFAMGRGPSTCENRYEAKIDEVLVQKSDGSKVSIDQRYWVMQGEMAKTPVMIFDKDPGQEGQGNLKVIIKFRTNDFSLSGNQEDGTVPIYYRGWPAFFSKCTAVQAGEVHEDSFSLDFFRSFQNGPSAYRLSYGVFSETSGETGSINMYLKIIKK